MWMKQWPFAHTIEMTHRLRDGVLEVETAIVNMSADRCRTRSGSIPYFQLTDSASRRVDAVGRARGRTGCCTSNNVPTVRPSRIDGCFPDDRTAAPLGDYSLDDVFTDLLRDSQGQATVAVSGKSHGSSRPRTQLPGRDDLVAEGPPVSSASSRRRHHQRGTRGARTVPGITERSAGWPWRERFLVKASGY
jgi:hypothetical protein